MQNVSKFKLRFKTCIKIISALTACLIFFLCNLVFINSTAFADSEQSDNSPIKACVFKFAGYHDKDENGRLSGYGIEFLNLVSQYSHLNFKYVEYDRTWGETQELLKNGEIDIATSASKTEDREQIFDFSLPIGRKKTVLSIRIDDNRYTRGDYSTYNGMKVGMLESNETTQNEKFKDVFKFTKRLGQGDDSVSKARGTKHRT